MEIKNLFDPVIKQEIIARINKLSPDSQRQWGKMNVAQMLAHLRMPLGVSVGEHKFPRSLFGIFFGRLTKKILYGDKPFKRGLPADKSIIIKDDRDFATEQSRLIETINKFREENISNSPHPFFGKLTKEQWSRGMWKHLDHHLQQFGV